MLKQLLLRGMLAGFFAGLLAFSFAKVIGEPTVEQAISLEAAAEASDTLPPSDGHAHSHAEEDELVSRHVQAGLGLFVGICVFTTAVGGLFSLVFAFSYGRASQLSAQALSATLALFGFVTFTVVPFVKYPPNPPAVGDGSTIGYRTALFFATIAIGLLILGISVRLFRYLQQRNNKWSTLPISCIIFIILISFGLGGLPTINEVPDDFPATLLWDFRMATLGLQALIWASLGIAFGWLSGRMLEKHAHASRDHVELC